MVRLKYVEVPGNYLDSVDTTVSTINAATGFPVSNLSILPVSKPWVTVHASGGADAKFLVDLDSARKVTVVALIGNLADSAVVTVRAGNSADPNGSIFEQSATVKRGVAFALIDATYRYWAVHFRDTSITQAALGYAVMGNYRESPSGLRQVWSLCVRRGMSGK